MAEEAILLRKPFLSAVIVAGGESARMGGFDKQFAPLCGVPVLARSLLAFERCGAVDEIVLVGRASTLERMRALAEEYHIGKCRAVVSGGPTRAASVAAGVAAISPAAEFLAIHDGARPLVLPGDISRCAADAFSAGGAILGVPATDTIKAVKKNGFVEYTPAREKLYAAQTPQIFAAEAFRDAQARAQRELGDWTDDSRVWEYSGLRVRLTPGRRDNLKITTPEDLFVAEACLRARREEGEDL